MKQIILNGEYYKTMSSNFSELFSELNIQPERLIVEYNGNILKSDLRSSVEIAAGDKVELISIVGGG